MSADNWTTCPRCAEQARQRFEAEEARVAALYGTVSAGEWITAREALSAADFAVENTFREDYEWWSEDGEVTGSYKGRCTMCGLDVEVQASKIFWRPEDERVAASGSREPQNRQEADRG